MTLIFGKVKSLKRNDEKDVLQHELDIDRLEGQIEEEDRDNEKLLREIKKSSKKTKELEKKKKGFNKVINAGSWRNI